MDQSFAGGWLVSEPASCSPIEAPEQAAVETRVSEINALLSLNAQGRFSEAAGCARTLTVRFPAHGFGWKALGALLMLMGRVSDAVRPMQRSVILLPEDSEAHGNLSIALRNLGRLDDALFSCKRALVSRPDFALGHNYFGVILHDQGEPDKAEAGYLRAIHLKPEFADALNNLGNILEYRGRFDEAEVAYRRALAIGPSSAEAHNNLGVVLRNQGRLNEARVSFQSALLWKPEFAAVYFNLHPVQVVDTVGITASIGYLRKSVVLEPRNTEYRFFLGMTLEYSGDPEAAVEHLEMASAGSDLDRARMDTWRYMKSASARLPLMTGSSIQTFRMGMDAANRCGLVMEFGVRFGATIRQIAALADHDVHGFDSFEGLPEAWHDEPAGAYSTKGFIPRVPANVTLYAGWFEDTLPGFLKNHRGPARFINIDCDIYSSTKTVLDLLAERIVPGTVIVFDEYIGNEHWRADEFRAFQEAVTCYGWVYEHICFSFSTKQVAIRIV